MTQLVVNKSESALDEFEEWITCWDCGGSGFTHHDCGEDCCPCRYPVDNVTCSTCDGEGGWKA